MQNLQLLNLQTCKFLQLNPCEKEIDWRHFNRVT